MPVDPGEEEKEMRNLVTRAALLMHLNRRPGEWNWETKYKSGFYAKGFIMEDSWIEKHLQGVGWLACRLRPDGLSDRIVFDLDLKGDLESLSRRYRAVRGLIGDDREPLVWRTPGGGLRVAYRITETPMAELTGPRGPLTIILRAAGLKPEWGSLEIYPANNQTDRQMFGARMPFLDARDLTMFSWQQPDGRPSHDQLARGIDHVERWYENPFRDLVPELRERADRLPAEPPSPQPPRVQPPPVPSSKGEPLRPSQADLRLFRGGLTAPHSRYAAEWKVGQAMILWPELFEDLGLLPDPADHDVALALAEWIARRANGFSSEWNDLVRRYGETVAIESMTAKYLTPHGTARSTAVMNMRNAAYRRRSPTTHLTELEHKGILRISDAVHTRGIISPSERFRFETWTGALSRAVKRQLAKGRVQPDEYFAEVALPVALLEQLPYGGQYRRYLDGLLETRNIRLVEPHNRLHQKCATYRIPRPPRSWSDDLLAPTSVVKTVTKEQPWYRRQPSTTEVYLALFLHATGVDVRQRYERRTAERIARYHDLVLRTIKAEARAMRVSGARPGRAQS
jgi:hypothetical protein